MAHTSGQMPNRLNVTATEIIDSLEAELGTDAYVVEPLHVVVGTSRRLFDAGLFQPDLNQYSARELEDEVIGDLLANPEMGQADPIAFGVGATVAALSRADVLNGRACAEFQSTRKRGVADV